MKEPESSTPIRAVSLLLLLGALSTASFAAPGDVDLSFDPGSGIDGSVNAMAVQPDGKVIVGGVRMARLFGDLSTPLFFAAWAAGFGLSGAGAAPDADPDKDGLPNATDGPNDRMFARMKVSIIPQE